MIWMANLMSLPKATPLESGLEALILTAASMFASVIATKIYAEISYSKTLRDHGVQIAKGIMVLGQQLEQLQKWVRQKRAADYGSGKEDSRLEHVEETLQNCRAMTDAALGGIAGVIGDALAQYETVMKQVSEIRMAASEKTSAIELKLQKAGSSREITELQAMLKEIADEEEKEISYLAKTSTLPIPQEPVNRRFFPATCPNCRRRTLVEIPDRVGETQVTVCPSCQLSFNAHVVAGHEGHELVTRIRSGTELVAGQWWLEPKQLKDLIPIIVESDKELIKEDTERSAWLLQTLVLSKEGRLKELGVSRTDVRKCFTLMFKGHGFKVQPGHGGEFRQKYTNDLTEEEVLSAVVRGCIMNFAATSEITEEKSKELTGLFLGNKFPKGKELVELAILEFLARSPQGDGSVKFEK
jgi:hypothetical protein